MIFFAYPDTIEEKLTVEKGLETTGKAYILNGTVSARSGQKDDEKRRSGLGYDSYNFIRNAQSRSGSGNGGTWDREHVQGLSDGRGSGTYHYLFYSCFRQRTGRNDLYTDEKGEGLPYGFCVFKRVGLSCEKIDRGANAL